MFAFIANNKTLRNTHHVRVTLGIRHRHDTSRSSPNKLIKTSNFRNSMNRSVPPITAEVSHFIFYLCIQVENEQAFNRSKQQKITL